MNRATLRLATACAALFGLVAAGNDEVEAGVEAWKAGDFARAVAEWSGPAEDGSAAAQAHLAEAYMTGKGVTADPKKARSLLEKAAKQGEPSAEANLGILMFRGGDQAKAMPLLEKAAARNEPRAQYLLGTALFNGDGVNRDRVRGYALVSKAADAGAAPARKNLAQMALMLTPAQREAVTALTGKAPPPPAPGTQLPPAVAGPAPDGEPPAATAEAAPPAPAGTGWKVQLGAFSSEASAAAQWGKVVGLSAFRGANPIYVPVKSFVRLQAGPFATRAAAHAACDAAKTVGQECFALQ